VSILWRGCFPDWRNASSTNTVLPVRDNLVVVSRLLVFPCCVVLFP
jgi:hypothetical protein